VTERVTNELRRLWDESPQNPEDLVFGITDTVKTSFAAACRDAVVEDFRFHDCRHTAITRMIQAGMPPMQVMKISGHTQMTTFARYVNTDGHTARNVAAALDAFWAENEAGAPIEAVNEHNYAMNNDLSSNRQSVIALKTLPKSIIQLVSLV